MLKKFIVLSSLLFFLLPSTISAATYSINPELSQTCTYSANVNLDTEGASVDGSDLVMLFDTSKLEILSVDNGSLFPTYVGKTINTTAGKISLTGLASVTQPVTGKGVFAKVNFKIKDGAPQEQTGLKFDFDPANPLKTTDSNVIESRTVRELLTQATGFDFLIGPRPSPSPTPIPSPVTKSFQINSSADDMNEYNDAIDRVYPQNSKLLWIGRAETDKSFTGLRFNNISLPKDAKIKFAKLEFYSFSDQANRLSMYVTGDKSPNSPPFSATSLPSKRPKTSASLYHNSNILWRINTWNEFNSLHGADFAPIVQEIVNQSAWQSGNSLSFVFQGLGNNWDRKFISSFDMNPTFAPKLTITYE